MCAFMIVILKMDAEQAFRQFKSHVVSIILQQWTKMEICTHGDVPQFNKIAGSLDMETLRESSSPND